jgi:hypothetical protein
MSEAVTWVAQQLAAAGFTPLSSLHPSEYFSVTGFAVEDGGDPNAARVTVTAQFTGQDQYKQWGEARRLAGRLMDVLQPLGVGFEEIKGREPNCAFDAYPPDSDHPVSSEKGA